MYPVHCGGVVEQAGAPFILRDGVAFSSHKEHSSNYNSKVLHLFTVNKLGRETLKLHKTASDLVC